MSVHTSCGFGDWSVSLRRDPDDAPHCCLVHSSMSDDTLWVCFSACCVPVCQNYRKMTSVRESCSCTTEQSWRLLITGLDHVVCYSGTDFLLSQQIYHWSAKQTVPCAWPGNSPCTATRVWWRLLWKKDYLSFKRVSRGSAKTCRYVFNYSLPTIILAHLLLLL